MKSNSGTDRRKGNSHNDRYWDRLKKQFEACAYDHTGAYSELRIRKVSPERKELDRYMDRNERIMQTDGYKSMVAMGRFHLKPDRLLRAATAKIKNNKVVA